METEQVKKQPLPSPQERPELYDDFDYAERPEGYQTGVKTPDYIQQLIDQRQGKNKLPQAAE